MSTVEIVFISFICLITLLTYVLNFFQSALIKRQDSLLKKYSDRLKEVNENQDQVLLYCLSQILKQSTDAEDYETALKCKELIESLRESKEKTLNK